MINTCKFFGSKASAGVFSLRFATVEMTIVLSYQDGAGAIAGALSVAALLRDDSGLRYMGE